MNTTGTEYIVRERMTWEDAHTLAAGCRRATGRVYLVRNDKGRKRSWYVVCVGNRD